MKNDFLKRALVFFKRLSLKPKLGGLQITNSVLRYVFLKDNGAVNTISVKLPPGVVSGGQIQSEENFLHALKQLHELLCPEKPEKKIKVVISLPSAITYTRNYNIPNVGKNRLEEAAELNLKMISPILSEDTYMSWQLIDETRDKFELFGAFVEAQAVDKFRDLLWQVGFMPMIFEFPSLSLSWVINNAIGPRSEPFLTLSISGDGLDIFLLKNGSIYFDYFRSWRSIQGNGKQISRADFNQVVIEEVGKVVNFTSSRFNETLKYIFIVAPGLEQEIKQIVEAKFNIQAAPFRTPIKLQDSSWYVALGAAIRGGWDRSEDRYVSLGTSRVEKIFFQERIVEFTKFWGNAMAALIATFLILMIGSFFLLKTKPEISDRRSDLFNIDFEQSEISELKQSAEEFNRLVKAVANVKREQTSIPAVLDGVREITEKYGVVIDSISISPSNFAVSMIGHVPSYERVIDLKNALADSSKFREVDMPFSKIFASEGSFVNFDVNFKYVPGEIQK
jgi:hypothetical protein